MSVLLLSYDLPADGGGAPYESIEAMIRESARSAVRPLYSQWFVETDEHPQVWHERMEGITGGRGRWFICPVVRPFQGRLAVDVNEWLNARV